MRVLSLVLLLRHIKPFFRLKGPGLGSSSAVPKMDLNAPPQPLSEVKAAPPKPDVPTVFDLVQREQEVKLLDLKNKQVFICGKNLEQCFVQDLEEKKIYFFPMQVYNG